MILRYFLKSEFIMTEMMIHKTLVHELFQKHPTPLVLQYQITKSIFRQVVGFIYLFMRWTHLFQQVVCNQLFLPDFTMRRTKMVPVKGFTTLPWTKPTSIRNVNCNGTEQDLSQCGMDANQDCPSQHQVRIVTYLIGKNVGIDCSPCR